MKKICIVIFLLALVGCTGSGGMGGQGFHITVTQGVPAVAGEGQPSGNTSTITITNTDGGTLQNPSLAVEPATETPPETPE